MLCCPPWGSTLPEEKNGEYCFCLLIPISLGFLADSVLIQTLAEMTPGMVLDLEVQEVLEDGSVAFSEGPVPGLVLRASKYHRAGEHFCLALHGSRGRLLAHSSFSWIQNSLILSVEELSQ